LAETLFAREFICEHRADFSFGSFLFFRNLKREKNKASFGGKVFRSGTKAYPENSGAPAFLPRFFGLKKAYKLSVI
jgi:hypothetical protein